MMMLILCFCSALAFPVKREKIGYSLHGRPLVVETWGDGPSHYFMVASIHGNESRGTPLLIQLQWFLYQHPELLKDKTISFMLVANPDGWRVGRRENGRHVDINRNFHTENFGRGAFHGEHPLSEPETQALDRYLRAQKPERTIVFHEPMNCIDFDGPSAELAAQLSNVSGIRIKRLGSRSGSIGTLIGKELHKEVITFELPRSKDESNEVLWDTYRSVLLTFLDVEKEVIDSSSSSAK